MGYQSEEKQVKCELQDIETIMKEAGVILTGNAYEKAQDYLEANCPCATYEYLNQKRGK